MNKRQREHVAALRRVNPAYKAEENNEGLVRAWREHSSGRKIVHLISPNMKITTRSV